MKTNLTLGQIYFNFNILDFLFRVQAQRTLVEIVMRAGNTATTFDELSNAIDNYYDNLEDFEEDCYNNTATEILDNLEIEYK